MCVREHSKTKCSVGICVCVFSNNYIIYIIIYTTRCTEARNSWPCMGTNILSKEWLAKYTGMTRHDRIPLAPPRAIAETAGSKKLTWPVTFYAHSHIARTWHEPCAETRSSCGSKCLTICAAAYHTARARLHNEWRQGNMLALSLVSSGFSSTPKNTS